MMSECHASHSSSTTALSQVVSDLVQFDFIPIQRFTAPDGAAWHAFAAWDGESWWHEEPICWEVFVALIPCYEASGILYVCGTLLSPGVFVSNQVEWEAALLHLLPDIGEEWTRMEQVD
jgi:hypothetical protein